jgi:hypothetical protein
MVETKFHRDHSPSMAERINKRGRNSGGEEASTTVKTGEGPTRTFHNLHPSGSAKRHGEVHHGEGDITGKPRGAV